MATAAEEGKRMKPVTRARVTEEKEGMALGRWSLGRLEEKRRARLSRCFRGRHCRRQREAEALARGRRGRGRALMGSVPPRSGRGISRRCREGEAGLWGVGTRGIEGERTEHLRMWRTVILCRVVRRRVLWHRVVCCREM